MVGIDEREVERELVGGGLVCPACRGVLGPWGFARWRPLRGLGGRQLWRRPRRSICRGCGATHVLLPVLGFLRRRDLAEVIGQALIAKVGGVGHRRIAKSLGVHPDTVRGWLRRFAARAGEIREYFTGLAHALGADLRVVEPRASPTADAVEAIGVAARAAALERFTGYTGQRSPEQEVLDALRRQPDTGFAIHDTPNKADRLLAERAELQVLLQGRPPDRRPAFRQAELALQSAKKELYWARYRLQHAQKRLDEFGPLAQLRRQGRKEKASTLDQIDTFTNDVTKAEAKIARCERTLEELRPQCDQRQQWDADHGWPDSRLRTVDDELAELRQPVHPSVRRDPSLWKRAPGNERPAWLDRTVEVAPPRLPADPGHGIDLGL